MSESPSLSVKILWLLGIALSFLSLLLQIAFYVYAPRSRKIDQKILTHLTLARLANTVLEYTIATEEFYTIEMICLIYAFYMHTYAILVSWMFIFTKHLYEKVTTVFLVKKRNLFYLSIIIFTVTMPVGVLCPIILIYADTYFDTYYIIYAVIKFVVLFFNIIYFCRIFTIAFKKSNNRNITDLVKSCVVSFVLVCITSFQALVTDLTSIMKNDDFGIANVFCVINSFQAVAMTIIFIVLTQSNVKRLEVTCRKTWLELYIT